MHVESDEHCHIEHPYKPRMLQDLRHRNHILQPGQHETSLTSPKLSFLGNQTCNDPSHRKNNTLMIVVETQGEVNQKKQKVWLTTTAGVLNMQGFN